jgi:hypothetical protein
MIDENVDEIQNCCIILSNCLLDNSLYHIFHFTISFIMVKKKNFTKTKFGYIIIKGNKQRWNQSYTIDKIGIILVNYS